MAEAMPRGGWALVIARMRWMAVGQEKSFSPLMRKSRSILPREASGLLRPRNSEPPGQAEFSAVRLIVSPAAAE